MSFWILSHLNFLCLVPVSVFEFCHNLSFWVLSQLEFLSFVTIWFFKFLFHNLNFQVLSQFFYHLNTLTTDQLSGQLFAILAMFFLSLVTIFFWIWSHFFLKFGHNFFLVWSQFFSHKKILVKKIYIHKNFLVTKNV